MHAAGLYRPPLSHSMNPPDRAVSPLDGQGTPDVEEGERMRGGRKKGRRSVPCHSMDGLGCRSSDPMSG
ncbi:hypothetical protein GTY41_36845 [Streptomyces sp. SID685]|nr:hypothetical protein [Streptomyces sp. SID685]